MNIDKMISDVVQDTPQKNINDLVVADLTDDNNQLELFNQFKNDIELYINDFLTRCEDINAAAGMYKCSLETWQACITEIGLYYFKKNKYLLDKKKIAAAGGVAYDDKLLCIGLELYEYFCYKYKKQFFIYDCCRFLGIDKNLMYRLSDLHSDMLKKAHTSQEASMRSALASGRSNVTAMAILLNHDYDYTRTTQVIHTTGQNEISAEKLPELGPRVVNNDILTDDLM